MSQPEFDYETWSEFRYQIRVYTRTAEAAARKHGLEPQQHQLLLAVRGFPKGAAPTIGDLAERLQIRHHSAVELVDRMEQAGLVKRQPTGVGRAVAVKLTALGRRGLDAVSDDLKDELGMASLQLLDALKKLVRAAPGAEEPRPRARASRSASAKQSAVTESARAANRPAATSKSRRAPAP